MFTNDFTPSDKHYFPYPSSDNIYHWWDSSSNSGYIGSGLSTLPFDVEFVQHLAVQSLLYGYRVLYFPGETLIPMPFGLDEKCREEYASKLIPRAVGYSAGLLNYFFRGSIDMTADPNGSGQHIISNYSTETLEGAFSIYYDDASDNRISIQTWNLAISPGASTFVNFTRPTSPAPKNPDSFVLVFYGTMGQEEGAVIGKVLPNLPVPTLPAPEPVSPLAGGYVYGPDHDEGLVWKQVSGGNGKYEVSIDNGNSIVVTGTKYSSISGLTQAYHTWKVATQNSAGVAGPWSATNTFLKYNYLSAPTIISPITTQQYDYPTLDWSPVAGAQMYYLTIYDTAVGDFRAGITLDYSNSRTWQSQIALDDGLVYWDVEARDERGVLSPRSSRGSWTQKATLAVPSLSQPQNGSTTTEGNPILQWTAVSNADSYDVYIDATTYNTTGTSYAAGVSNGTHTWKVRARKNDGAVSNWSSSWSFTSELKPCNTSMLSGGYEGASTSYELGKKSGTFLLAWNTYEVADQIDVIYGGTTIYSTGMVSYAGSHAISYSGSSSSITIRVTGNPYIASTVWEYTVGCP